ncbi:type I-E CRISPR-associated protein Cas6/Cse3/CasE [Diaphorobacter sp. J5-51]|uniref:type I-E CRISPR-associated protein Cas6/Cse3/CasE n=1 Tax=Diaphorobacter sp. J5-51 TaxID=680496 RepID=UPI0006432824|nr:type I-E CRISPR-associated protein Cas6/Cse3/CasE [Diaphorobacter sp. J5-51]KLR58971.1 hypothetical protein OX89_04050 [Diaphorobacter sp. J5-51]
MREILIAIPGLPTDLYHMHQCVWEHAARAARPGVRPVFLYRVEDGMVRVRSRDFLRGTAREFRGGACGLDIAAVIQSVDGSEHTVPPSDLVSWASGKLAQAGFVARKLDVLSYELQQGFKRDKASGRGMRIRLPVARLRLDLEVQDDVHARAAWCDGIGRGRRFGLGMLCH